MVPTSRPQVGIWVRRTRPEVAVGDPDRYASRSGCHEHAHGRPYARVNPVSCRAGQGMFVLVTSPGGTTMPMRPHVYRQASDAWSVTNFWLSQFHPDVGALGRDR